MFIETELKLRIAPESLARLKRHALLKTHQAGRVVTRRLYSIYYDTPKLDLHRGQMALRLRRAGRKWLQTLKGGGSVEGGLHRRNEWEIPLSRAELDFSMPEWGEHLPSKWQGKLQPVFVTDFSRSSRMVDWQGALIEVCMDRGEVRTEQHSAPICELELELKSGDPQPLFGLALAILEIVPFELEAVSKAESGYRLLVGAVAQPVKGVAPDISRIDTLPRVLQTLIWSCLSHLQDNLYGAMWSDDAEYLHQTRVALRRLRVVLRMTEKIRADGELSALCREVAAMCVALGEIREWDVFIAQTIRPMCARMAGHGGLQALLAYSERQRNECHVALRGESQSRDMQRLILRFSIWMNGAYWQHQDAAPQTRDFAVYRLRQLSKRFARAARQLNTLDAARLHTMRILAKKLRYSAEFFSGLYGKKKSGSFLASLGEVQEVLGKINDVAVAHRLLDESAADQTLSAHQEAIALAKGWIAHDLSRRFTSLHKAMRCFAKQPNFWGC